MKRTRRPAPPEPDLFADDFSPASPPRRPGRIRRLWKACVPPRSEWKSAWPAFAWSLLSAVLLRLAYAPIGFWPVAFVALVPWLWGLRGKTPAMAFWISWWFGWWQSALYFIFLLKTGQFHDMAVPGLPLMHLYLGVHVAVVGALIVRFARRLPMLAAWLLAMLTWAAMEVWRGSGELALPLGFLGHSMVDFTSFAMVSAIGGVPLISAVLLGINLSLMTMLSAFRARWGMREAAIPLVLSGVLLGACIIYGTIVGMRRDSRLGEDHISLRVAMVQPNIDQMTKLASYSMSPGPERDALQTRLAVHLLELLDRVERDSVDIILTPESSFTSESFDYDRQLHAELQQHTRDLRTTILIGALDVVFIGPGGLRTELIEESLPPGEQYPVGAEYYNALWFFRPDSQDPWRPAADYRKVFLVPFGEAIPYLHVIPGLVENFLQMGLLTPGKAMTPALLTLQRPGDPDRNGDAIVETPVLLGPSICFEDLIPRLHRSYARSGVQLFVNATNDAWYDPSSGARLHSDAGRFRCMETGIPMLRVTNTGYTQWINHSGRIVDELPRGEERVDLWTVELPAVVSPTIYARFGDWFGWGSFLLVALTLLRTLRNPRSREDETA